MVTKGRNSLVVCPHPNDLDDLLLFENLVDQPMLDIDPSREGAFEITKQFLVSRRSLIGVLLQDRKESGHVFLQPSPVDLLGVALRLPCEHQAVAHQFTSSSHWSTGVLRPSRMESAIPGMDRRCRVS